jgi:hypothetical protein
MPRRRIRRKVRQLMRYAAHLATYAGPIAPGWPERIDSDIRSWIACLRVDRT